MRSEIQQAVKWTAAAVDAVRRPRGLVVLIYHRVGARTRVSVDLPRQLFADQLTALTADWAPVTLDEAVDLLGALPVAHQNLAALRGSVALVFRMTDAGRRLLEISRPLEGPTGRVDLALRGGVAKNR